MVTLITNASDRASKAGRLHHSMKSPLHVMERVAVRPGEERLHFDLPPALEAHEPPEARGLARDEVRLLVSYQRGDRLVDATFTDLPSFLDAGDLIVVNDSATLPAALTATRTDGATLALHLSSRIADNVWVVEPRQVAGAVSPLPSGEGLLALPGGGAAHMLTPFRDSRRLWLARLDLPDAPERYLAAHGRPIAYSYVPDQWPIEMYQTVFARKPGSAEMPSAGRAFSPRVLGALAAKGVDVAAITLHTGVASLEAHEAPYEEPYEVSASAAAAVNAARARGSRVLAVGTTVVRALESAADASGTVRPARGWTDLIITPQRRVRTVDALLTGFHEPKASHLSMLEAIAGRPHLQLAYAAALDRRYLWHEFGDLHLILP